MNEWDLIEKIKKLAARDGEHPGSLLSGIGDDCAVFEIGGGRRGLITTDISIEGVHFNCGDASPSDIGYKAMIANISDIAAMGGKPLFAFISLGIPDSIDESFVLSLYDGFNEASDGLGMCIAGGDLSASHELVINISLYGEGDMPILRRGARQGDTIYITGTLGDSQAGLEIVSDKRGDRNLHNDLVKKHLRPVRRIDHVPAIIKNYSPSAMIDVSDGLLSDLRHICEAVGNGFLLNAGAIPVSEELGRYCHGRGSDTSDYALQSGEEYELLFTSPIAPGAMNAPDIGIAVTPIGVITENNYRINRNGNIEDIIIKGFEHFSQRGKP